jgi:hypothetical protein
MTKTEKNYKEWTNVESWITYRCLMRNRPTRRLAVRIAGSPSAVRPTGLDWANWVAHNALSRSQAWPRRHA